MLALLMLTVFSFRVRAQNLKPKDVPAPVRTAFKHDNPKIKDVEGSMDGKNYKVDYYDKNKDYVINQDHEGDKDVPRVSRIESKAVHLRHDAVREQRRPRILMKERRMESGDIGMVKSDFD